MNYTIDEKFELSGYTAVIKTDQNLSGLLSDNFLITIRDTLTNVTTEIDRHNINQYGVSDTTSTNTDEWAPRSCIKNGGLYVNINGNTITYKQTIPCVRNSDSESIGLNTSEVKVYFYDENSDIEFYSKTLPFFQRSMPEKVDDTADPILEPTSARPDYDFDYRHDENATELATMSKVSKNFNYNSVGSLYVNNESGIIKKYNKNIVADEIPFKTPQYKTCVSAFYSTTSQTGILEPNYDSIESFIWNEKTDEKSDIPTYNYDPDSTATIEFFGCTANLIYASVEQWLNDSSFAKGYRENVVGLNLGFINNGIKEVIFQRVIITSAIDEDDPTIVHFTITNPHDSEHPCYKKPMAFVAKFANKAVQEDSSELVAITPSNIVDNSEVDGTITFDITDIDPTCPWTYVVDAWIDTSIENYNSTVVKNKTISREGPKQNPDAMNAGFKQLTLTVDMKKQHNYLDPSQTWNFTDIVGIYQNSGDKLSEYILNEGEVGILKFKIHNPNWNNSKFKPEDYRITVEIPELGGKINVTEAVLKTDENNPNGEFKPIPAYDSTDNDTQYVFYVYNIVLNHEVQTFNGSRIKVKVSVKNKQSENFKCAWNFDGFEKDVDMLLRVPTVKIPVKIYTCGKGGTEDCKKYQGKSPSTKETTITHELNEIYNANKELDTQESEYGWQDFKLVDSNSHDVRATADYTIFVEANNENVWRIDVIGFNCTASVIDPSSFVLTNLALDETTGIITWQLNDIVPTTITVTCNAYSLTSEYDPVSVKWTSKKFIPDEWDFFKDFTVFTQSKLSLLGAYVGVKSLYCTALEATNNAFIDNSWVNPENGERSRIYVDGDSDDLFDGQYKIKLITKTNRFPSNSFSEFMGDKYTNGGDDKYKIDSDYCTGQAGNIIYYSKNAHDSFAIASHNYTAQTFPYDQRVVSTEATNIIFADVAANSGEINIADAIPVIDKAPGNIPRLNYNYDNPTILPQITGNYTFDANGGTQVFDKLETSNGRTVGPNDPNAFIITFKPGEYVFDHINVANDVFIFIDCDGSKGEYVRLVVRNKASFGARLAIQNVNNDFMTFMIYSDYESNGDDDNAIFFEAGRNQYINDKFNYGVLVAPRGKVHFANGENFWSGAIWAKSLSLSNGVAFIGRGDFA